MNTTIKKQDWNRPAFALRGTGVVVAAGVEITLHESEFGNLLGVHGMKVDLPDVRPGADYKIYLTSEDKLLASPNVSASTHPPLGGFHIGLDGKILPNSIWDQAFRSKCADPSGMVLVEDARQKFWCDIYLMDRQGRSRAGQVPADGWDRLPEGYDKLRQRDAVALLAKQGKQLLSREEFALAADGVVDGKVSGKQPKKTDHVEGLRSRFGLEQATGVLWVWSRELDEDGWPYVLGGYWGNAGYAGPRRVSYSHPDLSSSSVGARGRSDHMQPAGERSESEAASETPANLDGAERIACERARQVGQEGWTADHDDRHEGGELSAAAEAYAQLAGSQSRGLCCLIPAPSMWPWADEYWKPSADPIRNLEKAGALIAAEIDRLQRKVARS